MAKGRRPGNPDTKAEILKAARAEFAAAGFDGATIRSIAAAASVDPALVMHYFSSKGELFAASLELPVSPATVIGELFSETDSEIGESLIRTMLTVWDTDASGHQFIAALRSATATVETPNTASEFIRSSIVAALVSQVPGPHAELKASLAASQLVGLLVGRYLLALPALVDASNEELASSIGPTIDRYLSGNRDSSRSSHSA